MSNLYLMAERTTIKSPLGKRLKKARTLAKLTGRQLCELAGLSSTVVSMIERGHIHKPSAETLASVAAPLGVPLDWLVRGLGPEPTKASILAAVAEAQKARAAA